MPEAELPFTVEQGKNTPYRPTSPHRPRQLSTESIDTITAANTNESSLVGRWNHLDKTPSSGGSVHTRFSLVENSSDDELAFSSPSKRKKKCPSK
ncbi:UNVERIFIED_CONTAM: hypothetical protein HDU68_009053, partial [Siphonaria sp. JEL0065]